MLTQEKYNQKLEKKRKKINKLKKYNFGGIVLTKKVPQHIVDIIEINKIPRKRI